MRRCISGFTLIEVVLALAILAVGVIATAPLFVYAAKENAVGGDLGTIGALAVQRLEQLRMTSFYNLENGGDLESDVDGFSDLSDPDFVVRWVVDDHPGSPAGMKVIRVRAGAHRAVIGQAKEVTVSALRGE